LLLTILPFSTRMKVTSLKLNGLPVAGVSGPHAPVLVPAKVHSNAMPFELSIGSPPLFQVRSGAAVTNSLMTLVTRCITPFLRLPDGDVEIGDIIGHECSRGVGVVGVPSRQISIRHLVRRHIFCDCARSCCQRQQCANNPNPIPHGLYLLLKPFLRHYSLPRQRPARQGGDYALGANARTY